MGFYKEDGSASIVAEVGSLLGEGLPQGRYLDWAAYLCHRGSFQGFLDSYMTEQSIQSSVLAYREIIQASKGEEWSELELLGAYDSGSMDEMHTMLEELFLEPIKDIYFRELIELIQTKNNIIEALHRIHKNKQGSQFVTVIMELKVNIF